jgi:hypothetical protein
MLDASAEAESAPCAGEVDVSRLRVCPNEFHAKLLPRRVLAGLGEHALNEGLGNADEGSMIGHAGDNGVDGFADVVCMATAASRFDIWRSTFFAASS